MLGDEGVAVVVQLLIDRDGLPAEVIGGELEIDVLEARRLAGGESQLGNDVLAILIREDVAGRGIMKLCHQLIVASGDEVRVVHLVGDMHIAHADERIAVLRVESLGGDGCLDIGQRTEVVHLAVAADDDRGLNELVSIVGGAAKLLDAVSVIGQGTLGVIRLRASEPDTCGGIQLVAVDDTICIQRPVVAVGVLRVLVPRRGGGEVAVLIRHGDMALAGRLGGDFEGDARKAVGTVVALLGELKVAAHDLILEGTVDGVHQLPVLLDAELMRLAVREKVAFAGLDLLDGIETVREKVVRGARLAVLDGEGRDDLTLGVGHAIGDDGMVIKRLHLELRAVDAGRADGVAGAVLDVVLGDFHTAAHDVVLRIEGVDFAVLGDGDVHLIGGVEVAVVRGGLADDVVAIRQGIVAGGGESLVVGLDDLDGLALGVGLAVHLHGVLVVVDDGEADAFKGSITLRGLAGLGVELLDGHAAANHRFGDFREIKGRYTNSRIILNLLEAHILIQLIALGCFGLVDSNRTTR